MAMKLNMLPPSVNNMSVRVFVRAAGIPSKRRTSGARPRSDGTCRSTRPGSTPTIETRRAARKASLGESCARDDVPLDAARLTTCTRPTRKRAMVDAANFYTLSIFYPLLTARDLSAARLLRVPGRGLDLGCIRRG